MSDLYSDIQAPYPELVWQDEHTEIWEYGKGTEYVAVMYDHYQTRFETREQVYEKLGVRIKEREERNAKNNHHQ